jgi:branched-chain amino acid transport system permease protein|uniref:Branched-chain amino acid ABC transporter permease n=1 Tax=Desulfobacca acetoxidans TaxID=60893 RepID=A0A7C3SJH8_9BACT
MDTLTLVQQVINGVSLGSLYALIAIGYTMVYGILRLINFAHGDLIMVSAYLAVMGVGLFSWPWTLAFGLALVLTGLLGVMLERGAYRPLRRAPRISLLISAIAASFLLENLALVIAGGRPKPFPTPEWFAGTMAWGGLYISRLSLLIPGITAILLAGLFGLIYRTQAGRAMRAIAYDLETTSLMGINIDRIISLAFFLGSLLAGAGGLLWAMKYPQVNPFMGILPGLKAFIAAVLGGIGNLAGAVVGGFILGILEIMIVALFPTWAGYRDALAFALLILILLVRPTGILGESLGEEKL